LWLCHFFPEDFGAGPAVVRREGTWNKSPTRGRSRPAGLGTGQHADGERRRNWPGAGPQRRAGAFAVPGSRCQGEAAFADLVFDAPAEASPAAGYPQGGGRMSGEKGLNFGCRGEVFCS